MPAVGSLPDAGSRVEEDIWIFRRPEERRGSTRASGWLGIRCCARRPAAGRRRADEGPLACGAVIDSHFAAVNEIRILRVRGRFAVFFDVGGMPIVEGDFAIHAAAFNASRTGILLAAAQPVWEGVVGGDVIHGSGGLVVPVTPRFAAVG